MKSNFFTILFGFVILHDSAIVYCILDVDAPTSLMN